MTTSLEIIKVTLVVKFFLLKLRAVLGLVIDIVIRLVNYPSHLVDVRPRYKVLLVDAALEGEGFCFNLAVASLRVAVHKLFPLYLECLCHCFSRQ